MWVAVSATGFTVCRPAGMSYPNMHRKLILRVNITLTCEMKLKANYHTILSTLWASVLRICAILLSSYLLHIVFEKTDYTKSELQKFT